ncbi:MAG: mismatch-specific DNA-glycosylase [Myxococcota bacterium]
MAQPARSVGRVDAPELPIRLARLQLGLPRGERVEIEMTVPRSRGRDRFLDVALLRVRGAGFDRVRAVGSGTAGLLLTARRAHTLPDFIRPRLRILFCGLNPSRYSAEVGIPFGRPGNRFWPAALAARLVERDRDPLGAIGCGVGFTDLAKRATARASEIRSREYAAGVRRLEELVETFQPSIVCFVGLDGWRRAIDRHAGPGWTANGLGGSPTYLMPSTSGLNARTRLPELVSHLRRLGRRAQN